MGKRPSNIGPGKGPRRSTRTGGKGKSPSRKTLSGQGPKRQTTMGPGGAKKSTVRPAKAKTSSGASGKPKTLKSSAKSSKKNDTIAGGAKTSKTTEAGGKAAAKSAPKVAEFNRGLGLQWKFMGLIVGFILLVVVMCFFTLAPEAESVVDSSLNKTGSGAVATIAGLGPDFFIYNKDIHKKYGSAERYQRNFLVPYLMDAQKSFGAEQILIFKIIGNELKVVANSWGNETVGLNDLRRGNRGGGVSIYDVDAGGGDIRVNNIAVRKFTKDVKGSSDLQAWVCISKTGIENIKGAFVTKIMVFVVLSILISFFAAWVLSGLVVNPVQTLIKDMNIVAKGNLHHHTKPHSADEIGEAAAAFNKMTQQLLGAREQELKQQVVERDLALAHEVQTNLLPKNPPSVPGHDLFPYYRSAREVGGDYYDILTVDKESIGIMVADVSGKGVQGSMIMAMTRAVFRTVAIRNPSPASVLAKVNRFIAKDLKAGTFVTALYGVYNIRTKELKIASAGHNPLVYFNAPNKVLEKHNPKGIALGFDKGPLFESLIEDQTLKINAGDRLVFYTDGVVEAMSPKKEEYGDDRFYDFVRNTNGENSKQFVERLVTDLDAHKGNAPQHDDITIVSLRREK